MSPHFPVLSAQDVTRALKRNGFVPTSQKCSHQKWRHANGWQVIVAVHGNKPIPKGTLKSIIEGSDLDVDDYRQLDLVRRFLSIAKPPQMRQNLGSLAR